MSLTEDILYDQKQLQLLIAEGDEQAFQKVYFFYAPRLRAYISRFASSVFDQEEIIQECFVQLWLGRHKLSEVNHLQAWLYRIAANSCMKYLRKQHNEEQKVTEYEGAFPAEGNSYIPISGLHLNELRELALQAISAMNDTRKRIYTLNREEGLKPSEIAEKLRMPLSTVKNNLSLANKEIRSHLEKAGYQLPLFILALINFFQKN